MGEPTEEIADSRANRVNPGLRRRRVQTAVQCDDAVVPGGGDFQENEEEEEAEEAKIAKPARDPHAPTKAEWLAHQATHLPYRS